MNALQKVLAVVVAMGIVLVFFGNLIDFNFIFSLGDRFPPDSLTTNLQKNLKPVDLKTDHIEYGYGKCSIQFQDIKGLHYWVELNEGRELTASDREQYEYFKDEGCYFIFEVIEYPNSTVTVNSECLVPGHYAVAITNSLDIETSQTAQNYENDFREYSLTIVRAIGG